MSTWIEERPPRAAATASEAWELVPADLGSGSWLVARGGRSWRAWAPPGVILTGESDEPLELWTTIGAGAPSARSVTVIDVLAAVPADFHGWAKQATADQLRILGLYVASSGDDESALQARATRERLTEELSEAERPGDRLEFPVAWAPLPGLVPRSARSATAVPAPFASLTDTEFGCLLRSLFAVTFPTWTETGDQGCDQADVITGLADGSRYLFQVEHHPTEDPDSFVRRARARAKRLHRARMDMHWVVTSNSLESRLRHRLLRSVGPWLTARHALVDAETLISWLQQHPATEYEHPKLRVARAAESVAIPPVDSASLARFAATKALAKARAFIRANRVTVIVGGPGSGKSMLLAILLAESELDRFTPVSAAHGFDGQSAGTILYWDDADDEGRLVQLAEAAHASPGLRLVATTRVGELPASLTTSVVTLDNYDVHERARVYYNHLWNARHLHPEARAALAEPSMYWPLLTDRAFTPRRAAEVVESGPAAFDESSEPKAAPGNLDRCIDRAFAGIRNRALPWLVSGIHI